MPQTFWKNGRLQKLFYIITEKHPMILIISYNEIYVQYEYVKHKRGNVI